jgi:hypothetical protein
MSEVKRIFNYSDVNMLTASGTIINSALAQQPAITAKRPLWTLLFLQNLQTRINDAFPNVLGVDNAADMRDKTKIVLDIMKVAEPNLTTFKKQVERDFKDEEETLDEILTTLGFEAHYKRVKAKDQEATIELLFKFDQNMTPALITQLANIAPQLITDIRAMATTLRDANINQETAKTMRGEITDAGVMELNGIYSIISDICIVCADLFKSNKTLQGEFYFSRAVDRIDGPNPPPGP